ncbi:T9SS C-terminal target domain-containing protein [Ornithobacterium rhinotracheale]|uniref:T9SS type A sorting domain-containing protein n=1 Tax=Ornithobacterium rhinotracheale TaxID=28251 RepID=UPI00129CC8A8|nr:T9SS type A sorting domain-containing protein [Ornithobacterium rhinotracheale]MRJ07670.1 T9SS C-terminal target domain-containing protein [Ornithobacterium rhinotracheale]UOH78266.1 T9SS type A sorting domain-containing protein [Ornithobacterium rhinotracheale]
MKKHLFLIASVFAAFTANAQSTFTVLGDTNVKVQGGALLYVQGDAKVKNYSDTSKKVSNDGKIKITNGLTNENATGANFVNEFPSTGEYGQLIVLNDGTNTGFISSDVKFNSDYVFYPLALPYNGITAGDVVKQVWGEGADLAQAFIPFQAGRNPKFKKFDPKRYENPLFRWNNETFTLDHLAQDYQIGQNSKQADYYAVSGNSKVLKGIKKDKLALSGIPNNKSFSVTLKSYTMKSNFSENAWGEVYGSYILDFTNDTPSGWKEYGLEDKEVQPGGFGDNVFYLANPYTSDIDLVKLFGNGNSNSVKAVIQLAGQGYNDKVNEGLVSNSYGKIMTGMTKDGSGDTWYSKVRPFETFAIKTTGDLTLNFNDNIKTFEKVDSQAPNNMFAKTADSNRFLAQVGIQLFEKSGANTNQRTYVAATNIKDATELYNVFLKEENTGVYTEQDGELASEGKLFVNTIDSEKYIGKPVKLILQNGEGTYIFKALLNKDAKESSNKFYFEDKKTGKVIKIEEDFEYGFTSNGTEKDRFAIYWAAAPKANSVAESAKEATNTTTVFRAGNDFKVRFDKGIRKADIYVYNISGQLVSSAKAVDASTDYVVPIQGNATVYIVKVVGDNGSVVTKKIIK